MPSIVSYTLKYGCTSIVAVAVKWRTFLVVEPAYCCRVSSDEYRRQQASTTESALVALINAVIDDTKLPLKDKKTKLKLFKAAHPLVFEEHFSNLLE